MGYQKSTQAFRSVVARVIKEHRQDLKDAPIECVFRDVTKGEGINAYGKLHVKTGIDAFLYFQAHSDELGEGDSYLVLELSKEAWGMWSDEQKEAYVDHFLAYAEVDEKGKLSRVSVDIEAFFEVVARRGKFHTSIKDFARSLQGKLPLMVEAVPEEKSAKGNGKADESSEESGKPDKAERAPRKARTTTAPADSPPAE